MNLNKETLMNLELKAVPGKPRFDGYSDLCLSQSAKKYGLVFEYKSPTTHKRRYFTLKTFLYTDTINQKVLRSVLKQLDIARGKVASGVDVLDEKRAVKLANKPVKKANTVNQVFDTFTQSRKFLTRTERTQEIYLTTYRLHISEQFGRMGIDEMRRPDVKHYLDSIESDSVCNNILYGLRQIERTGIDNELILDPQVFC